MAKELPYFKFEPAEYLTKNVSFCSLSAQGLFINICSYYWQRSCSLMKNQLLRRFNNEEELEELIQEGVIDLNGEMISIKFLDVQYEEIVAVSNKNSENGRKGGRPKNPNKTQTKPKQNPNESQTKGIREDKRREEETREDNIINNAKFSDECKQSTQWKEAIAMTHKLKLEYVNLFIDKFLEHLINHEEQKKTSKDFKSHFSNWIAKQNLSMFRTKPNLGRTNQVNQ